MGYLFKGNGVHRKGFFKPQPSAQVPQFVRVDGDQFVGTPLTYMVIGSATSAVAMPAGKTFGVTSDGGNTWTPVVAPAPVNAVGTLATNLAGTYVAIGVDTLTNGHVITSIDGGLTWAEHTPVGAVAGSPGGVASIGYSSIAGRFFFFDVATPEVWHSPDGLTWTATAMAVSPDMFYPPLNFAGVTAEVGFTHYGAGGTVQIQRSTDSATWTSSFNPGATVNGLYGFSSHPAIAGLARFFALAQGSGGDVQLYASADGITWTLASNSFAPANAPYAAALAVFQSELWNAPNDTAFGVARSADLGATWTPVAATAGDYGGTFGLTASSDGAVLYAWGGGIIATRDGTRFAQSLVLGAGLDVNSLESAFGITLACGDDGGTNGRIWKTV